MLAEGLSEADRVSAFKIRTQAKLKGVICPVHGQPPRLSFQGATLHDLHPTLRGCCDRLIDMANRAIGAPA